VPTLRTRTLADGTQTYSVLFRGTTTKGTTGQTSETFDSPSAAAAFIADCTRYGAETARRVLDARRPGRRDEGRSVADQLRAHVDSLSGITLGTRRKYERFATSIGAHRLGGLPLEAVKREDVAAWIRDLEKAGRAWKTISDRKAFVSAAFGRAVEDELMLRNPASGVKIAKTVRKRPAVFLTLDEFGAVLAQAPAPWHPILVTLAGTGVRIGEATALQVGDVDLGRVPPTLTVSRGWEYTGGPDSILGAPKTARGARTIGLGADVVAYLRPLLGRPSDAWLFEVDGKPVTERTLLPLWNRWVAASGIAKRPRLHDIRHGHASWMMARNYPLNDLSRRLGHASIKVTADTYGHLAHDAQTRAAALADMGIAAPVLITG
jgi:integrase